MSNWFFGTEQFAIVASAFLFLSFTHPTIARPQGERGRSAHPPLPNHPVHFPPRKYSPRTDLMNNPGSRILIFRPLDEAAMIGIARLQIEKMKMTWKRKREKNLIVPDTLIQGIGQRGHQLNEDVNGQEGGRIIRKHLVDIIETSIQQAATANPMEYTKATDIVISQQTLSEPVSVAFR